MCDVICKYKHKCSRYPHSCTSCRNNKAKRDYYQPNCDPVPWTYPHITYYDNGGTGPAIIDDVDHYNNIWYTTIGTSSSSENYFEQK